MTMDYKPASLNPIHFLQPNPHSMVFTDIEEREEAALKNTYSIIVVQSVMEFHQNWLKT